MNTKKSYPYNYIGDFLKTKQYNRIKAIEYAQKWAYKRNTKYYNFDNIGGDCTSFISQCIYAGSNTMNYKKHIGWYYNSINDRTPSWSGVEYLYNFLITNKGVGPRAIKVEIPEIEIGDVIQLKFLEDRFSHSLLVVDKKGNNLEDIYIATHTDDSYHRQVSSYIYKDIRFLHIKEIGIWN